MFTEQLLGHLTKAYDMLTHLINLIGTYFCGKWSCLPQRHINFSILKASLKSQFSHKTRIYFSLSSLLYSNLILKEHV